MSDLRAAVEQMGGQGAMAAVIGVKQQRVWNWMKRGDKVPPEHCVAIERATGRVVMRWDLRPDDWHRIWPELVGAEGAPAAPAAQEPTHAERTAA